MWQLRKIALESDTYALERFALNYSPAFADTARSHLCGARIGFEVRL
jgi:hypothetical protein